MLFKLILMGWILNLNNAVSFLKVEISRLSVVRVKQTF